jgi:hypothetical protein
MSTGNREVSPARVLVAPALRRNTASNAQPRRAVKARYRLAPSTVCNAPGSAMETPRFDSVLVLRIVWVVKKGPGGWR